MKHRKTAILRGSIYAIAYSLINWLIFMLLMFTPIWDNDWLLLLFGIQWLSAIPFYFIFKSDCNALYTSSALIIHITLSVIGFVFFQLFEGTPIIPHSTGWDGLIYIVPLIGLPLFGVLPIAIDGLIYGGKAFYNWLDKREGRR